MVRRGHQLRLRPDLGVPNSIDGPLPGRRTPHRRDPRWVNQSPPNPPRGRWRAPGAQLFHTLAQDHSTPARVTSSQLRQPNAVDEYVHSYDYLDGFGRNIQTQTFTLNGVNTALVSSQTYAENGAPQTSMRPTVMSGAPWAYKPWNGSFVDRSVSIYDSAGKVTTHAYDAANVWRGTTWTMPEGLDTVTVDQNNRLTRTRTNMFANVVSSTNPANATTTFEYDLLGRNTRNR